MKMRRPAVSLLFALVFMMATLASTLQAQIDARLMRYPDVSQSQITFVYAGDIWLVPKTGGKAYKLSSPKGEEMFPRFSPDGKSIAYTANYHGNEDIYVISTQGGTPRRLTHHPKSERMLNWYPDGRNLLYASQMKSGRGRYNQLYKISEEGGLADQLPVPYGEFGAISDDGTLLAYTPKARDFRNWKRYRGGWAPDIWLFNLDDMSAQNITDSSANDGHPMFHGNTLYFMSDRGPNMRYNIWAYNLDDGTMRQVTDFSDYDVSFPAIGPSDLVFQANGRLYRMDLSNEEYAPVDINVITDQLSLQEHTFKVGDQIRNATPSPDGKRAIFEARGELLSVPAEEGVIRNLTHSSGVAERYPAWSPDGSKVAFWSDKSGEYELYVRDLEANSDEKLTNLGAGYRYHLYWSPDSKKLAFINKAMEIKLYNFDTENLTQVDKALYMYQGQLNGFRIDWSADSRWMSYSRGLENRHDATFIYDAKNDDLHQVTAGFYDTRNPAFDPEGKYLYVLTSRTFQPQYSDLQNTWIYPNTTTVAAIPLRKDVESPLAPKNDVVKMDEQEPKKEEKADKEEKKSVEAVNIDFDGFEQRMVELPPEAGNYTHPEGAEGKLIYIRRPRTGSDSRKSQLVYFDLKEREEKTILDDVGNYEITPDGKKLLVENNGKFAFIDIAPDQKMDKAMPTDQMQVTVDPPKEWKQIFTDVWRFERDFFYDPNMHGVDWQAIRDKYGALVDQAVTRWDVNNIIGDMIAELSSSHTYVGGGDLEHGEERPVGVLGVDWTIENGAFRIQNIIEGAPWDDEARSPLRQPGVDVDEGDYVLAVNNTPMDTDKDPWAYFAGLADKTVELTVNSEPTTKGSHKVLVKMLDDDSRLRNLAWINQKRKMVDEASDGRIGYVYVPNTGVDGQNELVRQFTAQFNKDGLIIDERFNSGGQIPDRFIELLNREPMAFWKVRDGKTWQWPPVAHFGPKAMLINGWSGSGGDAFPYYFKQQDLGPLIGERTWGGLIGITGAPSLIDGGYVTVPTFRMYSPEGNWFPEGHGVEPDIKVVDDPAKMVDGGDPQLERAIEYVNQQLEENPYNPPQPPPAEDRSAKGLQNSNN